MSKEKSLEEIMTEIRKGFEETLLEVHRQVRVYVEAMKNKLENPQSLSSEEIADIQSTIEEYEKGLSE